MRIRTHTRRSTQWASTIFVYCIIFLGCPPPGLQQPRLAEMDARKQCVIVCVVHTWFACKQTTDVSSDTVCVCATVFLGATAQGYQWTVNERYCRGSRENIKK